MLSLPSGVYSSAQLLPICVYVYMAQSLTSVSYGMTDRLLL